MGTRNLTAVYVDGEYKIAQYGQWDGYPDGQGLVCLRFLRNKFDEPKFRQALAKLRWKDEEFAKRMRLAFSISEDGLVSHNIYSMFCNAFPELSRNTGAKILEMVQEDTITQMRLKNDIEFAADGLFCEWAWVIDLDKRTFEAYTGFCGQKLTEEDRFWFLKDKVKQYCVKLVKEWSLDDLPTEEEFLKSFAEEEEEDE